MTDKNERIKHTNKTTLVKLLREISSATNKLISIEVDCAGYRNGRANNNPAADALATHLLQSPPLARKAATLLSRGTGQHEELIQALNNIRGASDSVVEGWSLKLNNRGKGVEAQSGNGRYQIEPSTDRRVGLIALKDDQATQLRFSELPVATREIIELMLGQNAH